ncbi:NAD(P)/FAD-dependent oxidoreductase [Flavobacteriales bacterium]|nr:NAD(P)/FAD-dependent oxidoreductase [Flavobacteriales bacterium]MDC1370433.1 NAD(P)/FAD-dependent oxidoreductase [Flavobacteriales bacterium]|tara:strand:- start:1538 stop:2878 length:1341 start_codon:yes stop_codon:yes gene_type:complete
MGNHIVIIGNGITGITSARHVRKNDSEAKITVISAETDHFFSRTALMYIYMGHMRYKDTKPYEDWFWSKNRIDLVNGYVNSVDFDNQTLSLENQTINYDKLVIATGSTPNKFGWKGQDLPGVQGLYSKQDLDILEESTKDKQVKRAVIVGGGLIGVEFAEMLLSRGIEVTFLVRENRFWGGVLPLEEGAMIAEHMKKDHHVDLRLEEELDEVIEGENGRAIAVITKKGERIDCELVGLTAGVRPNIDFLKESNLEIGRGIKVNKFLETNMPNVYAAGDCAEVQETVTGRRPIEAVWYVGRMMGETLGHTLTGNKIAYEPGVWFNSAKFFDVEYQTYGNVLANEQEGEKTFYWKHPTKHISFRAVYDTETKALKGINNFGIRLRHKICDAWIKTNTPIEKVMVELKNANFDPEFYKQYENDIIAQFNKENGTSIKPKKRNLMAIFGK